MIVVVMIVIIIAISIFLLLLRLLSALIGPKPLKPRKAAAVAPQGIELHVEQAWFCRPKLVTDDMSSRFHPRKSQESDRSRGICLSLYNTSTQHEGRARNRG